MKTAMPAAMVVLALLAIDRGLAQICTNGWSTRFGPNGIRGEIDAMCVYDDGTGQGLYIAGGFRCNFARRSYSIVRYDGTWQPLSRGLGDRVQALLPNPGAQGGLVVTGESLSWEGTDDDQFFHLGVWRNGRWNAFSPATPPPVIRALAVFDDGTGPTLYAGVYPQEMGYYMPIVYKWTGTTWLAFGPAGNPGLAIGAGCYALAVYDDGRGPALYVGGDFVSMQGLPANSIARWDGETWESLEYRGVEGYVSTLLVHDAGDGPMLYVGGDFHHAGHVIADGIARWNGVEWSALPNTTAGTDGWVGALAEFQGDLYAGGTFHSAGGVPAESIAHWNATDGWAALTPHAQPPGIFSYEPSDYPPATVVRALAVYDDGGGSQLYIGGRFEAAGDLGVLNLVRWNGTAFSSLFSGSGISGGDGLWALRELTWNGDRELYALGAFASAGDRVVNGLARWNGSVWSPLGPAGADKMRNVEDAAIFDDGTGAALFICGQFDHSGGVPALSIAKWDGVQWHALGDGLVVNPGTQAYSDVWSLAVYDDGRGPALYASGNFHRSGNTQLSHIGRWDGASWSALGSGLQYVGGIFGDISGAVRMTVFDDGRGPALFVGGLFYTAGGLPSKGIARWDGQNWSAMAGGVSAIDPDDEAWVNDFAVYDDGSGPALCIGGVFDRAGGVPADDVARWTGSGWTGLGTGLNGVYALRSHDDGSGRTLYAIGNSSWLMRLRGATWEHVTGLRIGGWALESVQDLDGPALYVGPAGTLGSDYNSQVFTPVESIARYGCENLGDANCDGVLNAFDIDWFVLALTYPQQYDLAMSDCPLNRIDMNIDGRVNNFDIDPFVTALINQP